MEDKIDHLFLISIIYQLIDSGVNTSELSPNIQDWLYGLTNEYENAEGEDKEFFERVYWYADVCLNQMNGKNNLN
jgi:hypothetical protein